MMPGSVDVETRALVTAALVFQILIAGLSTLGTVGFLFVAPSLSGLDLGGGEGGAPAVPLQGHGFSLLDGLAALLVAATALFWLWAALDYFWIVAPLARGELLAAEAPALLLGLLQTLAGGVVPGVLLLVAARRIRGSIRRSPVLEARRADRAHVPSPTGHRVARRLGRVAMGGFGVLWTIAGVSMFRNQFYLYLPGLIAAASQGAPAALGGWFHFWIYVSSLGGPSAAYAAGTLQVLLGAALILGFARKSALWGGVFVSVFLWIVPEAFGGPFALGIFSLGPGIVYLTGMLGLIALDASYGLDVACVDGALEARWPPWARLAEVSTGLVPPIGRWYVRHSADLARAFEGSLGAVLAASALVAWHYDLGQGLGGLLASRAGAVGGAAGWASSAPLLGRWLAGGIIGSELTLAALLLLGEFRRASAIGGLGLSLVLWTVVEGFGGVPGPGYTDPGVGIAEAFAFTVLGAMVQCRALPSGVLAGWWSRRRAPTSPGPPVASG